ncbi:YadA-like family protein [Veillonella sp.]|uniref:YadA-like family protein n=1 Tax=Veillonella sp. TaxID=1926307 RepID=UPI0025802273|nr:YadA-like family protein [Veillonella sp.]MBS4890649.1 YadA-like family protein [Veillonella sp.]
MKKKLIMLGIMMAIGSGLNTHANSVEYTEPYPDGASSTVTVSGTGLNLNYNSSRGVLASSNTMIGSSLIQIMDGKEEQFGPYKNYIVIRPGFINNYDGYGNTYMIRGNVGAQKITTDADGNGIRHYSELTSNGLDNGNNKIINVKAGEDDTDGVNVKQLKDSIAAATSNITDKDTITTVTAGDNTVVTSTGHDYKVSVSKTLTDMTSATFGSGDKRNVVDKAGVRVFDGSVNTGVTSNGIVIENTDTLEQASYTGSGMQASDDNATVRFTTTDITAGNQIVHGVKAGVADTDAVNVKQLNELGSQVNINTKDITELKGKIGDTTTILNESKSYTDTKFNEANSYTDQRIAKAGAANAALSGLKYLDYDANHKFVAAASFGQYKGSTSGAIGIAYQPNEDVLVHLGTTIGSEHMLNGGVSVRVGDSNKGVKANTKNLAKEMDMIKAENAELKAELAEIKAMLANR